MHFCEAEKRDRTADRLNAIQARLLGRVGLHSKSRTIKSVFSAFHKLCHAAVDNLFLTLPNHDLVKILAGHVLADTAVGVADGLASGGDRGSFPRQMSETAAHGSP